MKRRIWQRFWAVLPIVLTVIFFVVCYFLITTSGEDIHQGAHTKAAIWEDMMAAFRHNGRLPDMYAWAVINFFDYQYSFGWDTVFRLIDVVLGVALIYMMVRMALGEKLRLDLKMAMLWGLAFCMIFLTPHGRVLYAGFSAIHNYLLIAMTALGFGMVYLTQRGKRQKWWATALILIFGIGFGMSSNLTPIAFLITVMVVLVWQMIREKKVKIVLHKLRPWGILGVVGIVIGMGISYIDGPGVSGYLDSGYTTEYDYVSFSEVMSEPVESIVKLVKHCAGNFGRVLLPLAIVVAVIVVLKLVGKKTGWKLSEESKKLLVVLAIFVVVHVLIAAQLMAPIRILLPAYLAGAIGVMILAKEWLRGWRVNMMLSGTIVAMIVVVMVRTILAIDYHEKAGKVLRKILETNDMMVCVTPEEVKSRTLPVVYLGQEDMLADWAMPEMIYRKGITWCE